MGLKSYNEHQITLFEHIQKLIPDNRALVDVISELLNISHDAAYRRIRGEKIIDFEETVFLANHFKISLDAFIQNVVIYDDKLLKCSYSPLDLKDVNNHLQYLKSQLNDIESIRMSVPNAELIMSAATIPTCTHVQYKELTFFILYSWSNSVYDFSGRYEDFVEWLDVDSVISYYEKIVDNYLHCPSTEIWTANTMDRILSLLSHYYEMGYFNDEKMPLLICEQLMDMISTMQHWAEKNSKGPYDSPYKLYVSEIEFDNSYVLYKRENESKCFLRLFTINGITSTDMRFCNEIEQWLENITHRSTLISGTAGKERYKFFTELRQKVKFAIDRINKINQ